MQYELEILVADKPVTKYSVEKDTYIEGRDKTSYKIKLKNNTNEEAEFVVSVDGLSIIDGKLASETSTGYIVKPYQTSIIDGWMVDHDTAAKFVFGSKKASYSEAIGQGTDNVGVIAIQVFKKKYVIPSVTHVHDYWNYWPKVYPRYPNDWFNHYSNVYDNISYSGVTTSLTGSVINTHSIETDYSKILNNVSLSSAAQPFNGNAQTINCSIASSEAIQMQSSFAATSEPEPTSLGTEFGEAIDFKTHTVSFERNSNVPEFVYVLYYGDSKDLKKLGVTLDWEKPKTFTKPNPFPGQFCTPPKNWK